MCWVYCKGTHWDTMHLWNRSWEFFDENYKKFAWLTGVSVPSKFGCAIKTDADKCVEYTWACANSCVADCARSIKIEPSHPKNREFIHEFWEQLRPIKRYKECSKYDESLEISGWRTHT